MKQRFIVPQIETGPDTVLYYKLWAGLTSPGKVFDYSLNGNLGTVVHAPPPVYPGFRFDGANDYINTNNTFQSTFQGSFSVSAWIRPDDGLPAATEYFIGGNDETAPFNWLGLGITNTGILIFVYGANSNSAQFRTSGAVFSNGQEDWHHVMAVADSTIGGNYGLVVYLNGILQTANPAYKGDTSGITFADYSSPIIPYIGALNKNGVLSNEFTGLIDDVMFFNAALSAQQIRSIFESTRWRYGV